MNPIKQIIEMERLCAKIQALTGSKDVAEKALSEAKRIAKIRGCSINDCLDEFNNVVAYGIPAEEALTRLSIIQ